MGPRFHPLNERLPEGADYQLPAWRNGRRKGLKIPYPERGVRVRVPPPALDESASLVLFMRFCWVLLVLVGISW